MVNYPPVTIGIPVYIGAATFATAFETLAAQNYANLEIINSGNASADGAPTIYVEYARRDFFLCIIRKPPNKRIVANFRIVLKAAQGEYFMCVDACCCQNKNSFKHVSD
ncbi:MAG: glycosyltransferase [Thiobacillus sp.]|nr:glycosyltransferase [Thiobacillus sp.]